MPKTQRRRRPLAPSLIALFAALLIAASAPSHAVAQRNNPFADPEKLFEAFLGKETEEDRRKVQQVAVSLKEERRAGETALKAYLEQLNQQQVRVTTRGEDVEYLLKLAELLRPQMKNGARYKRINVYLADSDATDARSFPGGSLVFHRGMLDFVESEAALVGVIGHELSHLDRGHQLYHLRRIKLAQKSFAEGGPNFMTAPMALARAFARPFRPADETEADADGARWAYAAGYDPREMAALFLRMHRREGDNPKNLLPAFLHTHPYHVDRFTAVSKLYDDLQKANPRRDLYIGKQNMRQRTPRDERRFDE